MASTMNQSANYFIKPLAYRSNEDSQPRHMMTVDVEDYYHATVLAEVIPAAVWSQWPSHVEKNTERLLQLFDDTHIKATFFVLGWVAERYPELVKCIAAQGHEVASHGYSHQLVYQQTPLQFYQETYTAKALVEDLTGEAVNGYRAASYSITAHSLWALDILIELGFLWDSSIFPIYHDRYGMPGTPYEAYEITTAAGKRLVEFPLTTAEVLGAAIPSAGGGYFRQFPYWLFKALFHRAATQHHLPQMFYIHPWEIDGDQPRVKGLSRVAEFRHYRNIPCCQQRLERLMSDFSFASVDQVFRQLH